ncbi:type II secretion system F family protein [Paracraurococcus lichenis]|uniref:Type II secretion system F family protein n=1 Tax=Paracraurococcus lichenis TaxID=3064888 RepID=A0ABT9DZ10_9PROT|nr:type II secretion system F family protein [Paracraurococcus sp. LOR1-02]MDO9709138.1 type II secretion system F family protein [Paracraurococcus sp. LOR1-02]
MSGAPAGLPMGLLMAGGGLLGLALAVLLGLGALRRQDALRGRLGAVVAPHRPAETAAPAGAGLLRAMAASPWLPRLAALFGLRLDRAAEYPLAWWIPPLAALPLARAAAGLIALLAGDLALLAAPLLWFLLCRWTYGWMDARRREILFRQFPDALGMVTRAVRVGIPVSEAIRNVAREAPKETAGEFRRISDRLQIGLPLEQALAETAHRNGVPEYRFFATALALQSQTGGGLSETLENLAEVIRKRVALKERGHALAAEARTSAGILAILPFFTGGVLAALSPGYVAMLFDDPGGQQVLAAAVGLLLLGILIMRQMIRQALS